MVKEQVKYSISITHIKGHCSISMTLRTAFMPSLDTASRKGGYCHHKPEWLGRSVTFWSRSLRSCAHLKCVVVAFGGDFPPFVSSYVYDCVLGPGQARMRLHGGREGSTYVGWHRYHPCKPSKKKNPETKGYGCTNWITRRAFMASIRFLLPVYLFTRSKTHLYTVWVHSEEAVFHFEGLDGVWVVAGELASVQSLPHHGATPDGDPEVHQERGDHQSCGAGDWVSRGQRCMVLVDGLTVMTADERQERGSSLPFLTRHWWGGGE